MKFRVSKTVFVEAETLEEARAKARLEEAPISVKPEIVGQAGRPGFGPGDELRRIISKFGFKPAPHCKCFQHIREMNMKGIEWCEQNIDTIVGWLKEEAQRAGIPFIPLGARIMVRKAISNAKKRKKHGTPKYLTAASVGGGHGAGALHVGQKNAYIHDN